MARVIIYDPAHENERVVNDLGYISASSYLSRVGVDVVIYGKGTTFPTLVEPSHLYWRHDAGEIRDMDAGEKSALDVEIAAAALASKRSGAKDGFESGGAQRTARRALLNNIVKDSIRWRTWLIGRAYPSTKGGSRVSLAICDSFRERTGSAQDLAAC